MNEDRAVTTGYCAPECPLHEDTISWRKDETAKVTLQYFNPSLRAGLELYGIILPWIVILGLILTTGLPIAGNVSVTIYMIYPIF